VLVSHRRRRGAHVLPGALGPTALGIGPDELVPTDLDEYGAWVLGRIVRAATAGLDDDALVVDHADLPDAIAARIAPHLGLAIDAEGQALLAAATAQDAKNPVLPYEDDRAAKAAAADDDVRARAARWLRPALDELLRVRR